MTAIARMTVLHLRTAMPYRNQILLAFVAVVVIMANRPTVLVPALALLVVPSIAGYPFLAADKAGLDTLYAVLPAPRRAVLLGYYAWALAGFLVTAAVGTAFTLVYTRFESTALTGHTILLDLSLAWAMFAVNIAIQFPLLIRYGYSRISVWGTTLPIALAVMAVVRLHVSLASLQDRAALLIPMGIAVFAASAALAPVFAGHRRMRAPAGTPPAGTVAPAGR